MRARRSLIRLSVTGDQQSPHNLRLSDLLPFSVPVVTFLLRWSGLEIQCGYGKQHSGPMQCPFNTYPLTCLPGRVLRKLLVSLGPAGEHGSSILAKARLNSQIWYMRRPVMEGYGADLRVFSSLPSPIGRYTLMSSDSVAAEIIAEQYSLYASSVSRLLADANQDVRARQIDGFHYCAVLPRLVSTTTCLFYRMTPVDPRGLLCLSIHFL